MLNLTALKIHHLDQLGRNRERDVISISFKAYDSYGMRCPNDKVKVKDFDPLKFGEKSIMIHDFCGSKVLKIDYTFLIDLICRSKSEKSIHLALSWIRNSPRV